MSEQEFAESEHETVARRMRARINTLRSDLDDAEKELERHQINKESFVRFRVLVRQNERNQLKADQ